MKTVERARARELRRGGCSVREIQKIVGVSRSSVSVWIRDIELTDEQHAALRARNPIYNGQRVGAEVRARLAREKRTAAQETGRQRAREGGLRFAMICMLYWAEGSKMRNGIGFSNSDPALARFFLDEVRAEFRVQNEKIRVACNLFPDHEEQQREIEDFWLQELRLPRECLRKTMLNRYSRWSDKKRKNKLPYGTCKIVVHDTQIVQAIYGGIQELAAFDRPEWLDL
jgi:hypothetical protein